MPPWLKKNLVLFRIHETVAFGDKFVIVFFVPFLLAKGLPMVEILSLHAIQNAFSLALQLPTGYLADRRQRKHVLFASLVVRIGSYLLMWAGGSFWPLTIAFATAGVGSSLYSGTNSAFLYDTLAAAGTPERYPREWGIAEAWGLYGFVTAALAGGYFLALNPGSPPLLNVICFATILVVPLLMHEPPRARLASAHKVRELAADLSASFRAHRDLLWIILFTGLVAALGQVSLFLAQYYLGLVGIAGVLFGILMAADYLTRGIVSAYAYRLTGRFDTRTILTILGTTLALGSLTPALSVALLAIPFFLFISVSRGLQTVVSNTLVNDRAPSEARATLLSGGQFVYGLMYIALAPLFGWIADTAGVQGALSTLGACALLALTLLAPIKNASPRTGLSEK